MLGLFRTAERASREQIYAVHHSPIIDPVQDQLPPRSFGGGAEGGEVRRLQSGRTRDGDARGGDEEGSRGDRSGPPDAEAEPTLPCERLS